MKYQVVKKEEQRTSKWSGGSTTEIFIYPEDANYAERHFSWRVSSATVELEESDFTPLYGVKRWIMPFDAPLLLKHRNQQKLLYEILLKPFEAHCFKGDWDTRSIGKTRDFNLMLKEGSYGILKHFKLSEGVEVSIKDIFPEIFDERLILTDKRFSLGVFSPVGLYHAKIEEDSAAVNSDELLIVSNDTRNIHEFETIKVTQPGDSTLNLVVFFVAYDEA